MASGLVQAYRKYEGREINFISLTMDGKGTAALFAKANGMPWPSGYEAHETIAAFGALIESAGSDLGIDTRPTIYVIDSKGRLAWTDTSSRHRHVEPDAFRADLEAAIDDALAGSSKD